jgi:hypothetical protein
MACKPFPLPGGGFGMVCGLRPPAPCQCNRRAPHVALCDWAVERKGRKSKTCDIKMCESCRFKVPGEQEKDYCPVHRKMYEIEQRRAENSVTVGNVRIQMVEPRIINSGTIYFGGEEVHVYPGMDLEDVRAAMAAAWEARNKNPGKSQEPRVNYGR